MGKRPAMAQNQRNVAFGILDGGVTVRNVARHFGVHPSTISRLRNRLRATGLVADRQRIGRPRKTSANEDRYVKVTSRRKRFLSALKLADRLFTSTGTRVTGQTIRNRLHREGLAGRRPYVGIPLTPQHARNRVNWATLHRRWRQQQWNTVFYYIFDSELLGYIGER